MLCSIIFSTLFSCLNAGSWTEQGKQDLTLLGVGLNTKSAAYAAGLENGIGSFIVKSTDLGATWTKLIEDDGLLNIGCASNSNLSAVLASPLGKGTYTIDGGATFKDSKTPLFGVQNIVKSRVNTDYGAASGGGISVSNDLGNTWKHYDSNNGANVTRYAAMPSENVWYVSAGEWLESTTTTPWFDGKQSSMVVIEINSKISLVYDKYGKRVEMINKMKHGSGAGKSNWKNNKATKDNIPINQASNNDGYSNLKNDYAIWGAIWKTSDGGSTWSQSYSNGGSFYFNQIDCCDENLCYAVAEGDTESGSNSPGARIFGTNDGGTTWTQQYWNDNDAASLMAVHCINENEAWAAGGTEASNDYNGVFLHTLDGGMNWNVTTVDYAVLFMDMTNDANYGIANALTKSARGVVYAYQ